MDKVGINSHLRMSSRRSSLLAGLGGGCSEVVVGVFGGRAGGFPSRGRPGLEEDVRFALRGTRESDGSKLIGVVWPP